MFNMSTLISDKPTNRNIGRVFVKIFNLYKSNYEEYKTILAEANTLINPQNNI